MGSLGPSFPPSDLSPMPWASRPNSTWERGCMQAALASRGNSWSRAEGAHQVSKPRPLVLVGGGGGSPMSEKMEPPHPASKQRQSSETIAVSHLGSVGRGDTCPRADLSKAPAASHTTAGATFPRLLHPCLHVRRGGRLPDISRCFLNRYFLFEKGVLATTSPEMNRNSRGSG